MLELLTVIAVVSVLAGLLLPALSRAKGKAQGLVCRNNLKQLQAAFLMYAHDNNDLIVPNFDYSKRSWVYSYGYGPPGDRFAKPEAGTNIQWLVDREYAAFADYIKNPLVYKCPGDKSVTELADGKHPRVRSYGGTSHHRTLSDFNIAIKTFAGTNAHMGFQPPAYVMIFVDTHPGYLIELRFYSADVGAFSSFPAYWHNNAGGLSFADGHVEMHRWIDPRTRRPLDERIKYDSQMTVLPILSPGNKDTVWLSDHNGGVDYHRADPPFP